MQKIAFIQSIDGFLIEARNIINLQANTDRTKFRATLRKPVENLRYTPQRCPQHFVWFEAAELQRKGLIR